MGKNFLKLFVESPEDLLILDSIIKENDIVGAKTVRIFKKNGKQEKRQVFLKIRVEKKKFEGPRLRLTGKIVEGPEDVERGYHTIEVKEGSFLEIYKKVDNFVLKKIEESERFKKKILAVTIDYGKVAFFEIRNYEIKEIFEKRFGIPGKDDPKAREKALEDFLKFVNRKIEEMKKEYKYIIVLGNKFLLEKVKAGYKVETPHYGIVAVKEIFRRREILKIIEDMDIAKAQIVLEEFMKRLAKGDERIAYGKDIENYIGRIEKAVFTKDFLSKNLDLLKRIEETGGEFVLVDEKTEVGAIVKNFGGIAILRW